MGIIAAGQQAAMGRFLAFTRIQENSADQAGATYLDPRRDQRPRHARFLPSGCRISNSG